MKLYFIPILLLLSSCHTGIKYPEGGYSYPAMVSNEDTGYYFLPLKKTFSRRDSISSTYSGKFYHSFNEPNLSAKSCGKDIFRFTYEAARGWPLIITLTPNEIIVKQGKSGSPYPTENVELLTPIEKIHYWILKKRFPIGELPSSVATRHYLDSMGALYPQLRSVAYYLSLINKATDKNAEPFVYTVKQVQLVDSQYIHLVSLINASGFWKSPFRQDCPDPPLDGDGFTLEANTKEKYNVVFKGGCPDDSTKLTRACQELIDYAHLEKPIHLIWSFK